MKMKPYVWAVAALFVGLSGVATLYTWSTRDLAFDSRQWKAVSDRRDPSRYRMANDLIRRMIGEHWDLDRVVWELGTPASGVPSGLDGVDRVPVGLTYPLGPWGRYDPSTFYIAISVDTSGHVANATVRPD